VGAVALSVAAVTLLVRLVAASTIVSAQPDPLTEMNGLRVTPPVAAPRVTFQGLDGRHVRLEAFRGRPVLLTFFTTW
jgi:cytochrome oxidase Cu insertion factor (SCO1/SenC/PrrC family)